MAKKKEKDMRYLKKRGKNGMYYFQGMLKSKRYNMALSTDEDEAIDIRDLYLYEIHKFGDIQREEALPIQLNGEMLFGEVATIWAENHEVQASTMKDYKSAMNTYILPKYGNMPIKNIRRTDIIPFRKELLCSNKRKNNIFVPMRCVFRFALEEEYIDKNPMALVKNLHEVPPDIYPLSMDEIFMFLNNVDPYYKNFFIIAFFTGMRFGEMAVLKWNNVDFKLGVIKVRETRVRGEEKIPKTEASHRDIDILPPVRTALEEIKKNNLINSEYVFLNRLGRPLLPNSINYHTWKPALKKSGLKPRSLYQTRHTFATLMLDSGEHPGWVHRMMGHVNMKMIYERYYKYIKNYQNNDGDAFMGNAFEPCLEAVKSNSVRKENVVEITPKLHQNENRESTTKANSP